MNIRTLIIAGLCSSGFALANPALANPFPDADIEEGHATHETQCVSCHTGQFGGEGGSEIYTRDDRRINSPSGLLQQLTACTTMLNLDLFPEDEYHIAGFLNKHFYKFE